MHTTLFNEALEQVERLNRDDQEKLLEILRRRLTERRRDEIAKNARTLRKLTAEGKVKRGGIEDLKKALQQ